MTEIEWENIAYKMNNIYIYIDISSSSNINETLVLSWNISTNLKHRIKPIVVYDSH